MTPRYTIEDRHLKEPKKAGQNILAFCPFHPDKNTKSLSVFSDRTRFKCHGCGEGGTAYEFLKRTEQLPVTAKQGRKPLAPTTNDMILTHGRLLEDQNTMNYLEEKRGWTKETILFHKLGITKSGLLSIPIYNLNNKLVNARLYNFRNIKNLPKFQPWVTGLGKRIDLFQINLVKGNAVYLFEGEPDSILARQLKLEAVAFTCGIGNVKSQHLDILKNRDVILCLDIDKPGRDAATKFTKYLARICPSVKNVYLPIAEPSNGDFTDFILGRSGGLVVARQEFLALVSKTPKYVLPQAERARIAKMPAKELKLEDAALAKNTGIKQKVQAMVIGKGPEPYLVPKRVRISCLASPGSKRCAICGLSESNEKEITFGPYDPEILQIAGQSQSTARGLFRTISNIPFSCTSWTFDVLESQNMDDLLLVPEISHNSEIDRPYIRRSAFAVDNSFIAANRAYEFEGYTAPHPYTHQVIHVFEKAKPTISNLDNYKLTDELKDKLSIFQAESSSEVRNKIEAIHDDFEDHVTHIWGRRDLLWAIDFAYHSVTCFKFQEELLRRGWVEVLILGDTRTGKTVSAVNLMNHYKAGEMIDGENLSYAGLVGGIDIVGNRKYITWGKLPLNDGRLVIIDEFSAMKVEEIERLSGIRSSGVAEITKIQSGKTMSRVRLIVISNPRNLNVAAYDYGVSAIKNLIGKVEDIARFDFATVMASNEIPPEKINVKRQARESHKFTSELCAARIAWIWSLKENQIIFADKTVDLILFCANTLSKKFHSAIPLVEPSEQRIKLARLSVSVAAMVCNTDNWKSLIVTKEHVKVVFDVLMETYEKLCMGYHLFSERRFQEETLDESENIKRRIAHYGAGIISSMTDQGQIQLQDFEAWTEDRQEAKSLISFLVKTRCIRKPYSYYVKTPAFIILLRELKGEMEKGRDFGSPLNEDESNKQTGLF